jgi:hypothetical protein
MSCVIYTENAERHSEIPTRDSVVYNIFIAARVEECKEIIVYIKLGVRIESSTKNTAYQRCLTML